MKKLLLVFKHEYFRRVKTRGFLFAVISMPIVILLAIALVVISARMQSNPLPIGYLDQSDMFIGAVVHSDKSNVVVTTIDIFHYEVEEAGIKALENDIIQAFFVIQPDYASSGSIEVLALEPPGDNAYERMESFIQSHLIHAESSPVIKRIEAGSDYTVQAFDGSREANMRDWFVVLFPFLVSLIFIIVINISGRYLMQSIVDEKENRTMEMIVTSVSPEALMIGKILGNLCVGLSQLLIWLLFIVLGAASIKFFFGYGYAPLILPVHYVILFGIIFPGFILIAALMTLVGVTAASLREAQQVSMLFTLPIVAPYWFAGAILQRPNHPLAALMSIFPLTAVVTMPLRVAIGEVPDWQLLLTVLLMWISAFLTLLLAAKVFRLGMLQYGKRMSIRKTFLKITQRKHNG